MPVISDISSDDEIFFFHNNLCRFIFIQKKSSTTKYNSECSVKNLTVAFTNFKKAW